MSNSPQHQEGQPKASAASALPVSQDAATVVRQMLEACGRGDHDSATAFFSNEAVYINVSFPPPFTGKAAVGEMIKGLISLTDDLKIDIVRQVQEGEVVMSRRAESWTWSSDGAKVEIEIMAHFVVSNGLITEWTDFFDAGQAQFTTHVKF